MRVGYVIRHTPVPSPDGGSGTAGVLASGGRIRTDAGTRGADRRGRTSGGRPTSIRPVIAERGSRLAGPVRGSRPSGLRTTEEQPKNNRRALQQPSDRTGGAPRLRSFGVRSVRRYCRQSRGAERAARRAPAGRRCRDPPDELRPARVRRRGRGQERPAGSTIPPAAIPIACHAMTWPSPGASREASSPAARRPPGRPARPAPRPDRGRRTRDGAGRVARARRAGAGWSSTRMSSSRVQAGSSGVPGHDQAPPTADRGCRRPRLRRPERRQQPIDERHRRCAARGRASPARPSAAPSCSPGPRRRRQ